MAAKVVGRWREPPSPGYCPERISAEPTGETALLGSQKLARSVACRRIPMFSRAEILEYDG